MSSDWTDDLSTGGWHAARPYRDTGTKDSTALEMQLKFSQIRDYSLHNEH